MKYILDRFEGPYAVCEDESKNMIQIPKYRLPMEAKEGDVLVETDGIIQVDDETTIEQRRKMKQIMYKLFE